MKLNISLSGGARRKNSSTTAMLRRRRRRRRSGERNSGSPRGRGRRQMRRGSRGGRVLVEDGMSRMVQVEAGRVRKWEWERWTRLVEADQKLAALGVERHRRVAGVGESVAESNVADDKSNEETRKKKGRSRRCACSLGSRRCAQKDRGRTDGAGIGGFLPVPKEEDEVTAVDLKGPRLDGLCNEKYKSEAELLVVSVRQGVAGVDGATVRRRRRCSGFFSGSRFAWEGRKRRGGDKDGGGWLEMLCSRKSKRERGKAHTLGVGWLAWIGTALSLSSADEGGGGRKDEVEGVSG